MQTKVFIHIGYTKTASTALQEFFTLSDEIRFVDRGELCSKVIFRNSFLYDANAARDFLLAEAHTASENGQVLVVSHERLTGNPHSGHYDSMEIAHRLYDLLPDARILVCLREQMSMLASVYKQYIRIGGVRKLQDYLMPPWGYRVPLFEWRAYEYDRLISHYYDIFGKEQCNVLLFEDLRADADSFFANLADIMNVSIPKNFDLRRIYYMGIAENQVERRRILNLFHPGRTSVKDPGPLQKRWLEKCASAILTVLPFLAKRYSQEYRCLDEVRHIFQGKFTQSNQRLMRLIDRNLCDLGYEV